MPIQFSDVVGTPVEGAPGSARPVAPRSRVFISPEAARQAAAPPPQSPYAPGAYSTRDPNAAYAAREGSAGYTRSHLDVANTMNEVYMRLMLGQPIENQDGTVTTPEQYYSRLAAIGDPMGLAWAAANGERPSSQIGADKIASYAPWLAAVKSQMSGQTADRALAGANAAVDRTAQAGEDMAGNISRLDAAASGRVPSAAEMQMRRGAEQAAQAQMGMASAARGGGAAAFRTAAAAGSAGMSRAIGDASMMRAQEMATARQQLTAAQQAQGAVFGDAARTRASLGQTALGSVEQGVSNMGAAATFENGLLVQGMNADAAARNEFLNAMLQYQNLAHGHSASVGASENQLVAAKIEAAQRDRAAAISAGASGLAALGQL